MRILFLLSILFLTSCDSMQDLESALNDVPSITNQNPSTPDLDQANDVESEEIEDVCYCR